MLFFRLLGKTLLFAAFLSLAYDGARMLATPKEGLLLTSLSLYLKNGVPGATENLERFFLDHSLVTLWAAIVRPLLVLPVSLIFGGLGAALFLTGYRRPPPEIAGD